VSFCGLCPIITDTNGFYPQKGATGTGKGSGRGTATGIGIGTGSGSGSVTTGMTIALATMTWASPGMVEAAVAAAEEAAAAAVGPVVSGMTASAARTWPANEEDEMTSGVSVPGQRTTKKTSE